MPSSTYDLARSTSSLGTSVSRTARSSFRNSTSDESVTLVRTDAEAMKGPGTFLKEKRDPAPYVKPFSSRRFMLRREVNDPPNKEFMTMSGA